MMQTSKTQASRWLLIAGMSLLISGLLALFLAAARTPFLDKLITDPHFFRRGLVIHVDLALFVWVTACIAALASLLPSPSRPGLAQRLAPGVAWVGVCLLLLSAGAKGSEPILANYIPVVNHPTFLLGLGLFAIGILLAIFSGGLFPGGGASSPLPPAAQTALRAAGVALLVAMVTVLAAWLSVPASLSPEAYYENLFWGGGHVLQVASVAAMMGVWLLLLQGAGAGEILPRGAAPILFFLLLLPTFLGPLLAIRGPSDLYFRIGFTKMMQWGIFPVVSLVLAFCLVAIARARRAGALRLSDGRVLGFAASAGLTLLGFCLGAMIRGSNTMVPAHYHAAIGGVTASFMAAFFVLLPHLGVRITWPRVARLQPTVFAVGQGVFALGFGLAGHFGMARKVYGAEQLGRSLPETVGLAVMGAGGLLAAIGGVAFLLVVFLSWRRASAASLSHRSSAWIQTKPNIPSRS